jgi:hypothetical protein
MENQNIIKQYTQFIYEQQAVAPMVRLDAKAISETWNSEDLITEALNALGESDETEGLAEACELLDLLDEATTSALEKPLRNAHKGELGKYIKAAGGDRRAALLAKIVAKAEEQGDRADLSTKGKATTSYWNKIGDRAAHLQAKHSAAGGGGDEGHEVTPKRLQQKRDSTRNTEGAKGKKPGDTWKTTTGHHGGKNSNGEIRYFKDEARARDYAHG